MKNLQTKLILFLCLVGMGQVAQAQGAYFQQDVKFEIHVRLDDENHFLHGREELEYTNNSPDVLDEIYMHLWPNAYSSKKTAFAKQKLESGSLRFHRASPERMGYIDSLEFRIDGQPVWWQSVEGHPDIALLKLAKPLRPGNSITITTPFRVKIPNSYSRLGHIGQQYQLTQWYPKPAVYDRKGWHPMPYLDQGEFYSEFGTFDVYITLPKNYVVGATGDLPEGDPELSWLAKREQLSRKMLTNGEGDKAFEAEFPKNEEKILHFHQDKVHDFAWFCDQSYFVLSEEVELPYSKKKVKCVAMFTSRDHERWQSGTRYIAQAVYDYSLWNGDYPYRHATAVDGALSAGAGMEYPNITVLSAGGGDEMFETVTMHEVGHNWFYGILGSNEREYPWMDEGLNTFMEGRYLKKHHPEGSTMIGKSAQDVIGIQLDHRSMGQMAYDLSAREGNDQPIQFPSADYSGMNYGTMVYMKTGLAFEYLQAYLGEEKTDRCFKAYFEKWKFKHPQPEDLKQVFETTAREDLDWFFDGLIKGKQKIDFKISRIKGKEITLKNRSGLKLPASLTLLDKDGNTINTYWTKPFEDKATLHIEEEDFKKLVVYQDNFIPDARPANNYKKMGLWRSCRPLKISVPGKYPTLGRTNLGIVPIPGFNTTDGFILGAVIHKGQFPRDHFRYHLMPMYGFKSKALTGAAGFSIRWLPNQIFRKIELKVGASHFANLFRSRQTLVFHVQQADVHQLLSHRVAMESHLLANRDADGNWGPEDWYLPVFGRVLWNANGRTPFLEMELHGEAGFNLPEKLFRTSASLDYRRFIGSKKKMFLRGRIFAGAMISEDAGPALLSYGLSGSKDPFGEHILLDRAQTSSWLDQQVIKDHGGFSTKSTDTFDRMLLAFNGSFKTPFLFHVFGDVAYGSSFTNGENTYFATGLRLSLFAEAFTLNFPLSGTVYGKDRLPVTIGHFAENITFSLAPIRMAKRLVGNNFDFD